MSSYSIQHIIETLENKGWSFKENHFHCAAHKKGSKEITFTNCLGVVDGFKVNKKPFKTLGEAMDFAVLGE